MLQTEELEVVYLDKLMGVMCSSDCKWSQNTAYIVKKASSKLGFLRRLKTLGAPNESLVDIYKLFDRSNLEFDVPLWSGAITKKETGNIERVQKMAVAIILWSRYTDYIEAPEDQNWPLSATGISAFCSRFNSTDFLIRGDNYF